VDHFVVFTCILPMHSSQREVLVSLGCNTEKKALD
jgi:hypothetical protein